MNRRELNAGLGASAISTLLKPAAAVGQQITLSSTGPLIGMLVHSDMILLDLVAPMTVFNLMGANTRLIAKTTDPVISDVGLPVKPTEAFEGAPSGLDVLFVPGGLKGTTDAMKDERTIEFLRSAGERASLVTSVCTGSLLLGAAGLLKGYRATSHWYVRDLLPLMGGITVHDRVVVDRNRITAGGATAGVDFGLSVVASLKGEEMARRIQLVLEYDPKPPFDAGAPERAGATLTNDVLQRRGPVIFEAEQAVRAAGKRLGI